MILKRKSFLLGLNTLTLSEIINQKQPCFVRYNKVVFNSNLILLFSNIKEPEFTITERSQRKVYFFSQVQMSEDLLKMPKKLTRYIDC